MDGADLPDVSPKHEGRTPTDEWKGAWGPNPPFHTPVFVLTHHTRPSIGMEGGTTYHFIDASPADRELEVLRLMSEGLDNAQIGERLFIRVNTVKSHALYLMNKLDASNRMHLVAGARQLRLLS